MPPKGRSMSECIARRKLVLETLEVWEKTEDKSGKRVGDLAAYLHIPYQTVVQDLHVLLKARKVTREGRYMWKPAAGNVLTDDNAALQKIDEYAGEILEFKVWAEKQGHGFRSAMLYACRLARATGFPDEDEKAYSTPVSVHLPETPKVSVRLELEPQPTTVEARLRLIEDLLGIASTSVRATPLPNPGRSPSQSLNAGTSEAGEDTGGV